MLSSLMMLSWLIFFFAFWCFLSRFDYWLFAIIVWYYCCHYAITPPRGCRFRYFRHSLFAMLLFLRHFDYFSSPLSLAFFDAYALSIFAITLLAHAAFDWCRLPCFRCQLILMMPFSITLIFAITLRHAAFAPLIAMLIRHYFRFSCCDTLMLLITCFHAFISSFSIFISLLFWFAILLIITLLIISFSWYFIFTPLLIIIFAAAADTSRAIDPLLIFFRFRFHDIYAIIFDADTPFSLSLL